MNAAQPTRFDTGRKPTPKPATEEEYAAAMRGADAPHVVRGAKSEILALMADGRERTADDIRRKLPKVSDRAIKQGLSALKLSGLITADYKLPDLPIYRIARGRK